LPVTIVSPKQKLDTGVKHRHQKQLIVTDHIT